VELRVYALSKPLSSAPTNALAARDCWRDLLNYAPAVGHADYLEFLSRSQGRLDLDCHSYTISRDGRLVHYGWLSVGQKTAVFAEVHQPYDYPEKTVVLYDFYTAPSDRGKGLYQSTLLQMVRDAFQEFGALQVYITVEANNGPSRHAIEKVGFMHVESLFEQVRLGRGTRWRRPARQDNPSVER
jgi:GNAT superfamily N-acetyltransferase